MAGEDPVRPKTLGAQSFEHNSSYTNGSRVLNVYETHVYLSSEFGCIWCCVRMIFHNFSLFLVLISLLISLSTYYFKNLLQNFYQTIPPPPMTYLNHLGSGRLKKKKGDSTPCRVLDTLNEHAHIYKLLYVLVRLLSLF